DAAPAGGSLARLEQDPCAEQPGTLGDLPDPLDIDVGQPQRVGYRALNDSTADPFAEIERQIRAAANPNRLRAPPKQLLIERPRVPEVTRVQLHVDDCACRSSAHPLPRTRESAQTHRAMSSSGRSGLI